MLVGWLVCLFFCFIVRIDLRFDEAYLSYLFVCSSFSSSYEAMNHWLPQIYRKPTVEFKNKINPPVSIDIAHSFCCMIFIKKNYYLDKRVFPSVRRSVCPSSHRSMTPFHRWPKFAVLGKRYPAVASYGRVSKLV